MEEIIRNRAIVSKVLLFEAFIVVLAGFVFFIFASLEFTYSDILPNGMFAKFSLKKSATNSSSILVWFYLGEAIKVIATIVIFALSFLFIETLNVGLVILSYSVMLLGNLIGLSILIKN